MIKLTNCTENTFDFSPRIQKMIEESICEIFEIKDEEDFFIDLLININNPKTAVARFVVNDQAFEAILYPNNSTPGEEDREIERLKKQLKVLKAINGADDNSALENGLTFSIGLERMMRGLPIRRMSWPEGTFICFAISELGSFLQMTSINEENEPICKMQYNLQISDLMAEDWQLWAKFKTTN